MKKEDVELVLMKSFDYWKSVLCNEIDLGELHELSNYIWDSIQVDQEIDAECKRIYVITSRSLLKLVTKGEHTFNDIYGNSIVLKFEDRGAIPCVLESGAILLSKEQIKEQPEMTDDFPDVEFKPTNEKPSELQKQMAELLKENRKREKG